MTPVNPSLITQRLHLRPWQAEDMDHFARLNADPEVMRFFPRCLSRAESEALVDRIQNHFQTYGYGFWAVTLRSTGVFIGMIGLKHPAFAAPFLPNVEVGWRLLSAYWGKGYATEGAEASIKYGLTTLQLPEIVSFTARGNHRSIAVMERLGMTRNPADDFDHPRLPQNHPLQRHVLYRITPSDQGVDSVSSDSDAISGSTGAG